MPWPEQSLMDMRKEFVELAKQEDGTVAELCRRYGISRKTGYKWLGRARTEGTESLVDRCTAPGYLDTR